MPADDGLWFDNQKGIGPAGSNAAGGSKKIWPPAFKAGRGRLRLSTATCWAERKDFQGGIALPTEENSECHPTSGEEPGHELPVVTQCDAESIGRTGGLLTDFTIRWRIVYSQAIVLRKRAGAKWLPSIRSRVFRNGSTKWSHLHGAVLWQRPVEPLKASCLRSKRARGTAVVLESNEWQTAHLLGNRRRDHYLRTAKPSRHRCSARASLGCANWLGDGAQSHL